MAKILYLSPMSMAGGGQRHAQIFTQWMVEQGHEIDIVFTRMGHRGCMFHFLLQRWTVNNLCYRHDDPDYPKDIGRWIDTVRYDRMVIDNDEHLAEIWQHSNRLRSGECKVVFVIHTENKPQSQIKSLTGMVWKLVCVSDKIARKFKWAHPHVIHNGAPKPRTSGIDVKSLMRIPEDAFVIGYIGRLDGNKDPEFLFDVARETNWWVLIVGRGPVSIPTDMVERSRVFPNEVAYAGDWYNAMDTYVLPSRSEGFPLAPIEALQCFATVAMTPTSDYPSIFKDHKRVKFFDHGNERQARSAIELTTDVGVLCLAGIDKTFDPIISVDGMMGRYKEVMEL